jgi:hypothetical protein
MDIKEICGFADLSLKICELAHWQTSKICGFAMAE